MIKRYGINQGSVIFLPNVDPLNHYQTIVCNWKTTNIIKINSTGYKILKIIDDNSTTTIENIQSKLRLNQNTIEKFIQKMLAENILYEI